MKRRNVIAILEREKAHKDSQVGVLTFVDLDNGERFLQLYTVERTWRRNEENNSCIPAGKYQVSEWDSPKFGKCFKIHNVLDRKYVLIHVANYAYQLQGCIAPGLSRADVDGDGDVDDVASSRAALNLMLNNLPESFDLVISTPNGIKMRA